jgi:ribonuclease HI
VKMENADKGEVRIYTDGACRGNPGIGGWGVLIIGESSQTELLGAEPATTNNRMELKAAIEGLEAVGTSQLVAVYTDSQ